MRFFWNAFCLELKRQFCSVRGLLVLILLPALTLALQKALPDSAVSTPLVVAFVAEDEAGEDLYEILCENENSAVGFTLETADDGRNKVATGIYDCAIVCGEDFGEKLQAGETEKLIRVVISDNSVAYTVVEEAVAAAVIRLSAPMEAERYLLKKDIITETMVPGLQSRLNETLLDEERVHVLVRNENKEDLTVSAVAHNTLRRLLILPSLLILPVWLVFAVADAIKRVQSPFGKRLRSARPSTALLFPTLCALLVTMATALLLTILM